MCLLVGTHRRLHTISPDWYMTKQSEAIKVLFFKILVIASLVVSFCLFIYDFLYDRQDTTSLITESFMVTNALVSLLLYFAFKKLDIATMVFLVLLAVIFIMEAMKEAGLYNPYFILFIVNFGFVGSTLLKREFLIIIHLYNLAAIIFMIIYQINHLDNFSPISNDTPITTGIIFIVTYTVVSSLAFMFKLQYEKSKVDLHALSLDLQEKNNEIEAQNEELRQNQEALVNINVHLEKTVEDRTRRILTQNNQLIQFSFDNAHKIRGPLARILGLLNIYKIDAITDKDELIDFIENETIKMDEVTKEINENLNKEIDESIL